MLSVYPACFYKEKTGGYSVIFPDLGHLATEGETLDQAMQMAIDCLAGYLYNVKNGGEKVPVPSELNKINPDDEYNDYQEAFVSLVSVDVDEYARVHFEKLVKKTLTIPSWLNERAIKQGLNFSQVLKEGLIKRLHTK